LWVDGGGRDVLFVINHPAGGNSPHTHTVEVFDVTKMELTHRATLTDPLLVMPNDLVAVGRDSFYLTNTRRHPPGVMQTVETYLQLSGATVLYYGNGGFRVALDDLVFPNGINASHDGRHLYVATVTGRGVRVYDRDPDREQLTFRREVALGSGADNIEVDAAGNLWIGAHPKLLRVGAHAKDAKEPSPSQVFRVTPGGDVEEIYLDDGTQISGSSVAAVRGDRLLVGQIFDNGFLDCVMRPPAVGQKLSRHLGVVAHNWHTQHQFVRMCATTPQHPAAIAGVAARLSVLCVLCGENNREVP
jgi:arylesterase/paraoxonase